MTEHILQGRQVLLFDGDCRFCRMLADFATRRASSELVSLSWQEFQTSGLDSLAKDQVTTDATSDRLRVWDGTNMYEGSSAWRFLLEHHKDMRALNWLAAKLGLLDEASMLLNQGGHTARRLFCWRCQKRV